MTVGKGEGIGDGFGHAPIEHLKAEVAVVSSLESRTEVDIQPKERIIFPESPLFEGNSLVLKPSTDASTYETVIKLEFPQPSVKDNKPVPYESLQGLALKQRNSRRLRRV